LELVFLHGYQGDRVDHRRQGCQLFLFVVAGFVRCAESAVHLWRSRQSFFHHSPACGNQYTLAYASGVTGHLSAGFHKPRSSIRNVGNISPDYTLLHSFSVHPYYTKNYCLTERLFARIVTQVHEQVMSYLKI